MGRGPDNADIMVVGRMANSKRYQEALELELAEVGLDASRIYYTSAIKCRNFDQTASNADVKKCKVYLDQEIARVKPKFVLALGNEALLATTGKSGITKYRGKPYEMTIDGHTFTVVPTVSPSAVARNPGQKPAYLADLRMFTRAVNGIEQSLKKPKYTIIDTLDKLKWLRNTILPRCEILNFDVETHSEEWRPEGKIISLSATCVLRAEGDKKAGLFVFALPLYHSESPFKSTWKSVLRYLAPAMAKPRRVVAHNGKYDCKWMQRFECPVELTFDTLLAIHLLNENAVKGLKPVCVARLGVEPWGIDTADLLNKPLAEILEYNVLDTWYMYHLYLQLRDELKQNPRLAKIFMYEMMPASRDLVHTELRGIWLDRERLKKRRPVVKAKLEDIHLKLGTYLPEAGSEQWPKNAKGKPLEINYNASNFARWYLFEHLQLPILERGKMKDDESPGDPSMREGVLMALKDNHPAVSVMLERVTWNKIDTGFFDTYETLVEADPDHRLHTNFKLAGTVTGRLSSGKADEDKISAGRGKNRLRGINLQQVPRDPLVRGLFGAPYGWFFAEADYSQVELRIAAFLAHEDTMKHLYSIGADIHLTTAARVAGLPESQISKEVRKKLGKPVNFGFLYGMSWGKFITTAFENYGAIFDEQGARQARETYFQLFPKLLVWHARQRRLVHKYGKVESPLGRIRHLPDIYSPDKGVRAEAERQAINSPVQGFASDMAVLSMIAINEQLRKRDLPAHCLGLVHDALNFEIRADAVSEVLPIIKDTMEDTEPLRKRFGVVLDIPIIADIKLGSHWGDAHELKDDEVYMPERIAEMMSMIDADRRADMIAA